MRAPRRLHWNRKAAGTRLFGNQMAAEPRKNDATFHDFFAGSGLVTEGLKGSFRAVWANDICPKKAAIYRANHGCEYFRIGAIEKVRGADLPAVDLAWASFPCQDLSLAGAQAGLTGRRSGLVWEWLRVMDEMDNAPCLLVAENVLGLVSTDGGTPYQRLHEALVQRGYQAGAVLLDAIHWVPQSRPRVFVVAAPQSFDISAFSAPGPTWAHHPSILRAMAGLKGWVWWRLPTPGPRRTNLADVLEAGAPVHDAETAAHNLSLLSPAHKRRLQEELADRFVVAAGYKRTRAGQQVLELRFDRVSGCLRTPRGGSSRQTLVVRDGDGATTRLLTPREAARLMGAPETYRLPGRYNQVYGAMGDAVAAPVAEYLARHLLRPLRDQLQRK